MGYYNGLSEAEIMARDAEKKDELEKATIKMAGIKEGIEIGKEQGIEIGKEQGIEIGKEQGIEIGKEQGIEIGKEQGIEVGKEQGRAEGIDEAQSSLIKTMHEKGMSAEEIARICDFDLSYVLEVLK